MRINRGKMEKMENKNPQKMENKNQIKILKDIKRHRLK